MRDNILIMGYDTSVEGTMSREATELVVLPKRHIHRFSHPSVYCIYNSPEFTGFHHPGS